MRAPSVRRLAVWSLTILLVPAAMPAAADPRTVPLPTGSYTKTCYHPGWKKGTNSSVLVADCPAPNAYPYTTTLLASGCAPGSVTNDHGHLKCTFSQAALNQYIVIINDAALSAAGATVMGRPGSDSDKAKWMAPGFEQNATNVALNKGTLTYGDAVGIFRDYLSIKATADERQMVYDLAMKQVYGRILYITSPTPYVGEMATGQAWYADIVSREREYLAAKQNLPEASTVPAIPPR